MIVKEKVRNVMAILYLLAMVLVAFALLMRATGA